MQQWTKGLSHATKKKPPEFFSGGYFYAGVWNWEIDSRPVHQTSALKFKGGAVHKRFTDIHKWNDPWFRKLSPSYKCFWLYICDNCDNAGVWKVDIETASHFVGAQIDGPEALKTFGSRIMLLREDYWLINAFVEFQFGRLSNESPLHKSILALTERHTLRLPYPYPKTRVQVKDKEDVKEVKDVRGGSEGVLVETKSAGKDKILEWFEVTWGQYPKERRVGKKASFRSYQKSVKNVEQAREVAAALAQYKLSKTVKDGFIKNASTFFANWEDYRDERRDQQGPFVAPINRRSDNQSPGVRGFTPAARIIGSLTDHELPGIKPKTEGS